MAGKLTVFKADQFTATEHTSAAHKAEFANRLCYFIIHGFKAGHFTDIVYRHLMNCFGHIAHTNREGFYGVWFATPARRVEFIKHTLEYNPVGNAKYTFSDVEREVQSWVKANKIQDAIQKDADTAERYISVRDVARTLLKIAKKPTGELVEAKVQSARVEVEQEANVKLDDAVIHEIVEILKKEFVKQETVFKLGAISENANDFGLHGYIFVAQDGEAWQCCGYQPTIGLNVGDSLTVALVNGIPQWSKLGFEVPEKKSNAPEKLVKELWG